MSKLIYVPVFHVTHEDLQKIKVCGVYRGEVKVPEHLRFSTGYRTLNVHDVAYAALSWRDNDSGTLGFHILKVDSWAHRPGESVWDLSFTTYAYDGDLVDLALKYFQGPSVSYLADTPEEEFLSAAEVQEWSRRYPEPLRLSLDEAAEAVAAKFGVNSSNVRITVSN